MGFWIFMSVMVLLIPFTVILIGKRFAKKPPKKINSVYGYRTSMSMKNKETWEFAHRRCGKMWQILGYVLLLLSIAPIIYLYGHDARTVGTVSAVLVALQILAMFCSIILIEKALKKNFDEHGNRR